MSNNETVETIVASNGVTLAATATPRILPDLTQANADKPAKAKGKGKGKGGAKDSGDVSPIAAKGVAAKHAANIKAASDKVRRLSRVEPLIAPMCRLFVKAGDKGVHVATLAKALKCSELDVRHAIDKVRAMGVGRNNLARVAPKTFGLRKGYKLPTAFVK